MNKQIAILDSTFLENNLGNDVILEAVYQELTSMLSDHYFHKIPRRPLTFQMLKKTRQCEFTFLGGTNALSGQWCANYRYGIPASYLLINNLILMGCGWWQWENNKPDLASQLLLKKCLSKNYLHAVRDSYTQDKLKQIGINNTLVTACPSLWRISTETLQQIPHHKADNAVFTLTDYAKKQDRDLHLINTVLKVYKNVHFFPQGAGDIDYLNKLKPNGLARIILLSPYLSSFDQFLENHNTDYIGTRLHGGIRAIQHGRRSLIIAIDNRGSCLGQDINLPLIDQDQLNTLEARLKLSWATQLSLPHANINKWKNQFTHENL